MRKLCRITQQMITNGCRGSIFNCPAGLSLKKAFPDENVGVDSTHITFFNRSNVCIKNPIRLTRFIRKFDAELPVKPINFYIVPPEK